MSAVAFLVYWASNHLFDAARGDFFYLADAFLHGRLWLESALGPYDVILLHGHVYVPFAPFPAVVLMPLVAVIGPVTADQWEPMINAGLAAAVVGLAWWAAARIGVDRFRDRLALVLLLGFSTQVWWVTTRGGVWHTGHLVAVILVLLIIGELFGKRRPWPLGLLLGAAFLTRAPIAFAAPALGLWLLLDTDALAPGRTAAQRLRDLPWRDATLLVLGLVPPLAFFFWYNLERFGSAMESGYALATLPEWLERQRQMGLFSLAHVPMNLDYLLLRLPSPITEFPYLRPGGLGLSVLITSPGLLLAARAPWRDARSRLLLLAAALVLVPTLMYYGGGWLQYGYRYFLDSIPFVWALVAMGVVAHGRMSARGWALVLFGCVVGLGGVYWAYNI